MKNIQASHSLPIENSNPEHICLQTAITATFVSMTEIDIKNTQGAINNRQSRETDNIGEYFHLILLHVFEMKMTNI